MLEGEELDSHGFLLDIEDLKIQVDELITSFKDKTLNELPAFEDLNPSLEHFSRILCEQLDDALYAPNITAVSVKLWEDDIAWAAYDGNAFRCASGAHHLW